MNVVEWVRREFHTVGVYTVVHEYDGEVLEL